MMVRDGEALLHGHIFATDMSGGDQPRALALTSCLVQRLIAAESSATDRRAHGSTPVAGPARATRAGVAMFPTSYSYST